MASANSMLCTIFLCDGIASFKPHCMSVIQLIDNIVSDSMIDVISHLSIDIAIKGSTLYLVLPVIVHVLLNRWTSQLDLGCTTGGLERVVSVHDST